MSKKKNVYSFERDENADLESTVKLYNTNTIIYYRNYSKYNCYKPSIN